MDENEVVQEQPVATVTDLNNRLFALQTAADVKGVNNVQEYKELVEWIHGYLKP